MEGEKESTMDDQHDTKAAEQRPFKVGDRVGAMHRTTPLDDPQPWMRYDHRGTIVHISDGGPYYGECQVQWDFGNTYWEPLDTLFHHDSPPKDRDWSETAIKAAELAGSRIAFFDAIGAVETAVNVYERAYERYAKACKAQGEDVPVKLEFRIPSTKE